MLDDVTRLARVGKVTASNFPAIMTDPRSKAAKERGELSDTAKAYAYEVIGEILHGTPTPEIKAAPLEWGNQWEADAVLRYELVSDQTTEACGFITHPDYPDVGATCDRFVGSAGVAEIKCPWNRNNHVKNLIDWQTPKDYTAQAQGQLWVTGRDWCDFVSFDPRAQFEHSIMVVRTPRDEKYIAELEAKIRRFLAFICEALERIDQNVEQLAAATTDGRRPN